MSVSLQLPGTHSGRITPSSGTYNYRIERELDLAPGENFDFGTIKLIRVFGKLPWSNVQVNEMSGPDTPRHQARQMVGHLWAENGEYEILLPPGYYHLSLRGNSDFVLAISEEDKEIQLDFDTEGLGGIRLPQ